MSHTKTKMPEHSVRNRGSGTRRRTAGSRTTPMVAMGLSRASKSPEGIRFEATREMTVAESEVWNGAKRGRGRPKKPPGEKAARVLVTITPDLLAAADAFAARSGISRAELFARGLAAVLPKSQKRGK